MNAALDKIQMLPWQLTILTWVGGATFLLFLALIIMMFLHSLKKRVKDKAHAIFCFIFIAFIIALGVSIAIGISFLVDAELGWKLSLLAGASVILGALSLIMMLVGGFAKMVMRIFYFWMVLAFLSFATIFTIFNLVMMTAQKAQG